MVSDAQQNSASDAPPIFRTHDLRKVYGDGDASVQALRGVTTDVRAGEIVVFLGPSGSGKSTLLNILGGLDRPTSGDVYFRDQNLTEYDDAALTQYRRENVGFVFQFYNLVPGLTARENVELVTEIAHDPMPADDALALVGLDHRIDHFPSQMSGGEQQRVAVARAIAKQPDVMFCDEPTGALDRETGVQVLDALVEVNRSLGTTLLIVTHNAGVAGMADRVLRFVDGAIEEVTVNADRLSANQVTW
ncbi:MAG: ABC transporter ATP-binding protein [Alphaproteobacteria bacterium]|nr:ABC transporter ATP-binding protein [Alphaproteobacteria bacterium]